MLFHTNLYGFLHDYFQPGYYCLGSAPVVDGDIIPDEPIAMRQRGEFQKLPMIAGQTSDDGSPYTIACMLYNM